MSLGSGKLKRVWSDKGVVGGNLWGALGPVHRGGLLDYTWGQRRKFLFYLLKPPENIGGMVGGMKPRLGGGAISA